MVGYVGTVERQDTRRDGPHLPLSILRSRPGIRRARAIGLIRLERREKLLENCLGHEKAIIKYFTKISTPNNLPKQGKRKKNIKKLLDMKGARDGPSCQNHEAVATRCRYFYVGVALLTLDITCCNAGCLCCSIKHVTYYCC